MSARGEERSRENGPRRGTLHRRLFGWFSAAIVLTVLVASGVFWISGQAGPAAWNQEIESLKGYTAGRFARVWADPAARDELAKATAEELNLRLTLRDPKNEVIRSFGPDCDHGEIELAIRNAERLGFVGICIPRSHHRGGPIRGIAFLLVFGLVLFGASSLVAVRIARPLSTLATVARDLGQGRLESRATVSPQEPRELYVLSEALNDMAKRIQGQIEDQKMLLAAVSHELRTPLGHLRILIELARDGDARSADLLFQIEREVIEIDALVGELLAGSRLDFKLAQVKRLDAKELARRSLERAGLDPALLVISAEHLELDGDPTLLLRALANLLDNAIRHASGVRALRVVEEGSTLRFEVEDPGPGLAPGQEDLIFTPFFRGPSDSDHPSLGLGLTLVRRIAEAHGGSVLAANCQEGGARIGFSLPRSA